MNELIHKIIVAVDDLSDTEKETLIIALTEQFGEEIEFSIEKLTMVGPADLEIIHSSVYGMVITKKRLPEILARYQTQNKLSSS